MASIEKTFETESLNRRAAFISWRWLAIGLGLIVVLLVGVMIGFKSRRSDLERGTLALVEAFSKRRLIEPRLSGGFKSGEFNPSPDDKSGLKTEELERARGFILEAVAKGDPKAQLAYGRLLLSEIGRASCRERV